MRSRTLTARSVHLAAPGNESLWLGLHVHGQELLGSMVHAATITGGAKRGAKAATLRAPGLKPPPFQPVQFATLVAPGGNR